MSNNDDKGYYAFDQCKAYPLPDNRVLVRNPRSGRQAVLTPDVYGALTACTEFATLDHHAERLAADTPGLHGQEAAVRQVLASVRGDGLLISADIYAATLNPAATPRVPDDRPVAAVITWERPEALARCLDSLADNCDLGLLHSFFVIDDSRDEDARARNREASERFAQNAAIPVRYLGIEAQRRYMAGLIHQLPQLENAIRFLIDRDRWAPYWTSGLARTVALLVSAGRRLLVLDDDILCEVYEPPREDGPPSFSDAGRQAAFFAGDQGWQDWRTGHATDPLLRHLRCLGATLSDALGALGAGTLPAASFAGATVPFLERLDNQSPVLVTECGSLGDPGTSRLDWITALTGTSLERLLSTDEAVENALSVRNCWSGQSRPRFGPRANMSQFTGLDNRHLLPPYIPIMRGEDRLFGDMTAFLHPGSVVLDDAWAVPHRPIPERAWSDADRRLHTATDFPRFSMAWVEEHADASNATEPMMRLRRLAQLYDDLAEYDHGAIVDLYIDRTLAARAEDYRHLRSVQQATVDAPAAWQSFIADGVERLNRELAETPTEVSLRGYPEALEDRRLTAWWQEFWREFAQALQAWPTIRQAARQINENPRKHD